MLFEETCIQGAYLLDIQPAEDERGFFARVTSKEDLEHHGLCGDFPQCSISFNHQRGTLRGMHFQRSPHQEVKLVRCVRGALYDVIIDLRAKSPSFKRWFGVELTADNRRALYVPHGVAHGFVTLQNETELFYQISTPYVPDAAAGVRWDDPAFGIEWPVVPRVISLRDRALPHF